MENDHKVILNVGGQRFETNKATLKKIPATRLSRLTEALANYDRVLNEYFFDRHPGVFSQILNYYRTGKLHYPTNVCGPLFEAELEFWGLDSNQVEPCCWKTYTKHRDTEETLATLETLGLDEAKTPANELALMFHPDEDSRWQDGTLPWYKRVQPVVWQLFYEPRSSQAAKIISYISIMFITLSIITFCLSTVNGLCKHAYLCRSYNIRLNMTHQPVVPARWRAYNRSMATSTIINLSLTRGARVPTVLDLIEYTCIAWFTFEILVKFVVAPSKRAFFRDVLNWIDVVANLWFYLDIVYNYWWLDYADSHPAWDLFGTVRIMRLWKFSNHHPGLKVILASLKASAGVLRLLVFFISVGVIIFASLVFYSEKMAMVGQSGGGGGKFASSLVGGSSSVGGHDMKNDNEFVSIFEAFWFSIASLTTVGFGDYTPRTPLGMFFGAICTVAGVLMIDLPMPIIVANFANYYNHLQARSKLPKKLRRRVLPVEAPRQRPAPKTHKHGSPGGSAANLQLLQQQTQQPILAVAVATSKFGSGGAVDTKTSLSYDSLRKNSTKKKQSIKKKGGSSSAAEKSVNL